MRWGLKPTTDCASVFLLTLLDRAKFRLGPVKGQRLLSAYPLGTEISLPMWSRRCGGGHKRSTLPNDTPILPLMQVTRIISLLLTARGYN